MRKAFADTGYWVALLDRRDSLHAKARNVLLQLPGLHVVTSEGVLTEVLSAFCSSGPQSRAEVVSLVRRLQSDSHIEIVPSSNSLFEKALELYEMRPDKNWSLVDCASFVIMQELGVIEALAYDQHFMQAGFKALLREE